jgi:hypothetical protein
MTVEVSVIVGRQIVTEENDANTDDNDDHHAGHTINRRSMELELSFL